MIVLDSIAMIMIGKLIALDDEEFVKWEKTEECIYIAHFTRGENKTGTFEEFGQDEILKKLRLLKQIREN